MADAHLTFGSPAATDAHLTFGGGDDEQLLRIAVDLGGLGVAIAVDNHATAEQTIVVPLGDLGVAAVVEPAYPVPFVIAGFGAPWREGASASVVTGAPWPATQGRVSTIGAPWRQGTELLADTGAPWATQQALRAADSLPWSSARPAASSVALPWHQMALLRPTPVRSPWRDGQPVAISVRAGWRMALDVGRAVALNWHDGQARVVLIREPWRDGRVAEAHGGPLAEPPEPHGLCYTSNAHLVFQDPAATDGRLVFVCETHGVTPPAVVVVPVRRVYMVQNEVSLRRVDGDIAIDCPSLQLSIDADSWAWGFSASVPGSELSKLEPAAYGEPVELEAVVNGMAFRVLAEGIGRDRSFNRSALRVSGRSRAAVLDTPYVAEQAFGNAAPATANQLAEQALLISGVPSGWLIDWSPEDWLVAAGAWSFQGSPIAAINRVAEAAGAYVQAHPSEERLLVLPRYPVRPWDWATVSPDFELPSAVVQRESIDWADRVVYNRVYISGSTTGGVLAEVTRAGTAGDLVAPMVTDSLCTTIAAGRQRAMPILANVGRQATVGLRLPVLPETGVIRPGAMVRYVDGGVTRQGLVRSISVEAGRPQVWQTIGVQTYA